MKPSMVEKYDYLTQSSTFTVDLCCGLNTTLLQQLMVLLTYISQTPTFKPKISILFSSLVTPVKYLTLMISTVLMLVSIGFANNHAVSRASLQSILPASSMSARGILTH